VVLTLNLRIPPPNIDTISSGRIGIAFAPFDLPPNWPTPMLTVASLLLLLLLLLVLMTTSA
jgi:hypothetical protein